MHRPVLFNKTITMKREELFEGAIVLSKECNSKKRSRHEVVEVFSTSVKLRSKGKYNSFFYASLAHIRPAKITLKSVRELGLEELWCNPKLKSHCTPRRACFYVDADVKVLLNTPFGTLVTDDVNRTEVHYMHELQREIKSLIKLNRS